MEKESINHILFDFYSVVDTDIGMARLMNNKYNNPSIVNPAVFGKDLDTYKILMLNRKFCNPLVMFLNESYRLEADNIYREITNTPEVFQEVLNLSVTTSIFDILNTAMTVPSLEPTVLCYNEAQANHIKSLIKDVNVIMPNEETSIVDVEEYDTLIFKFIYPNSEFRCGNKEVHGKNIYICKYRFNMAENEVNKIKADNEVRLYSLNANEFYFIEVYANASLNATKEEII